MRRGAMYLLYELDNGTCLNLEKVCYFKKIKLDNYGTINYHAHFSDKDYIEISRKEYDKIKSFWSSQNLLEHEDIIKMACALQKIAEKDEEHNSCEGTGEFVI